MKTLRELTAKALLLIIPLFIMQACSSVNPRPFKTAESVKPPMGAVEFLQNSSGLEEELFQVKKQASRAEKDIQVELILQDVLEELLDRFESVSDFEQYGKVEYWAAPSESIHINGNNDDYYIVGDCDEFALHAWIELKKRGIKARLVAVLTEEGTNHIVVESGGWILDNRLPYVVANNELDYRWDKISGYAMNDPWKKIDNKVLHQSETLVASTETKQ